MCKGLKVTFLEYNQEVGRQLQLFDYENSDNNDWLIVNQFEIQGDKRVRRPDVLVFINGLPLVVIELKNPADECADIWAAYNQLQTYKENIPDLFNTNAVLVISEVELLSKLLKDEIKSKFRKNVSIDWAVRESVRAKLRVLVKTLLKRYGYPPDQQEKATRLVLSQAEAIAEDLES